MVYFDSDYMSGAVPEILERLKETNRQHFHGYGSDELCEQAKHKILEQCHAPLGQVAFLEGGTQTNASIIDYLIKRGEGVLAADTAHINVHEAGAIEFNGHKVIALPGKDGKLTAQQINDYCDEFYKDETWTHMVNPAMVYLSFPTELGTLYSQAELEEIYSVCQKFRMPLYIDGARLAYGLASPACDLTLDKLAHLCDIFYIGGTKCGVLFGEAVVTAHPDLLKNFTTHMKRHGALLAKGWLLGLQFDTLFTDNLYERVGQHAVRLAMRLKEGFLRKGYQTFIDSPTNQQFFILPNSVIDRLRENVSFEYWGARGATESKVRFVTSWATTDGDIDKVIG